MAWTTIPNSNLEPGAPIRSVDGQALRDNVEATADGDSGAPRIQEAAMGSWYYTTGGVGTYAFLGCEHSGTGLFHEPGDTVSGGHLFYTQITENNYIGNTQGGPSGTWRCMGYVGANNVGNDRIATLWLRIS